MVAPVLKWEIPIDNADHQVTFGGEVTGMIGSILSILPQLGKIEFWTWQDMSDNPGPVQTRSFRVFQTGVSIPEGYTLVGTTARNQGQVFHLFEKMA